MRVIILTIIFYFIAGFALIPFYKYHLNPDTISYISIAQRYVNHDFIHAINGGWSPMISWLLIPFLYFKADGAASFLIINILAGFIGLLFFIKLQNIFSINQNIKSIGFGICAVLMLHFSLSSPTPDLLSLVSLLALLFFSFQYYINQNIRFVIFCGIAGAISYFCKSYNFWFFIAHFTSLHLLIYLDTKNILLKNYFTGLFFFLAIATIWIIPLSKKYDRPLVSSAASYNHAIINPTLPDKFSIENEGLIPPSDSIAISAFETFDDMSHYKKMKEWSPFSSSNNFIHQLKIIAKNIYLTIAKLEALNPLCVIIIIFLIVGLFKRRNTINVLLSHEFQILFFIIIYISGYLLLRIQERYLWFIYLCILLFALNIISKQQLKNPFANSKIIFTTFLILSFLSAPIIKISFDFNAGKNIYLLSESLKNKNIKGNFASNENYSASLILAYNNEWKYFGIPFPFNSSQLSSVEEIKMNKIDYLLWWGKENIPAFLNSYTEVTNGIYPELKIYKMK